MARWNPRWGSGEHPRVVELIIGVVCALFGGLLVVYGSDGRAAALAALVEAGELSSAQAEGRAGLVAVRGEATAAAPIEVELPGGPRRVVAFVHERAQTVQAADGSARQMTRRIDAGRVEAFRLGSITVHPGRASLVEPDVLAERGDDRWLGIAVDEPITVIGALHDGVIAGGELFRFGPTPLAEMAVEPTGGGRVFALAGGLLVVIGLGVALRAGWRMAR